MNWSKEIPTKPGFYWAYRPLYEEMNPIKISEEGDLDMIGDEEGVSRAGLEKFWKDYFWQEIEKPELPK